MTDDRDQVPENGTAVEQAEAIAAQAYVTEAADGAARAAGGGPGGGSAAGGAGGAAGAGTGAASAAAGAAGVTAREAAPSAGGPRYYASRETLDREMAEIKDEVLRMGSLVASQIGVALESLVEHDADKATAAIVG